MRLYKPLFIIFTFSNDSYLSLERISKDVKTDTYFFYVKEEEQCEVKEISIGSEGAHNEEYAVKKDDKNVSPFKKKTKAVTKELVDNKFHFLLLMVSTILFESSIPLAILNIQTSNLLYIFLFICSGIGIAMNFYAYWDYFKKGTLKQTFFYSSVTINALSILMGIGIFCLFYNISTKAENGLGLGMLILIGAAICISICLATILITYFVQTARRKKIKYNE